MHFQQIKVHGLCDLFVDMNTLYFPYIIRAVCDHEDKGKIKESMQKLYESWYNLKDKYKVSTSRWGEKEHASPNWDKLG